VHRYSDTIDMGSFGRAVGERHAASSAAEPRRMERQNSSPALGIAFSSAGDEKYGSDMFSAPIWSHAEEAAIHPLDTSQDISDRTILPPSQDTSDRTNLSPSPSFAQLQMTSAPAPGRSGSTDSGVPKAKSKLRTLFSTKGSVVKWFAALRHDNNNTLFARYITCDLIASPFAHHSDTLTLLRNQVSAPEIAQQEM
jgi:hypothetical protein